MAIEAGHMQLIEYNKETIPTINWMVEDLFCRYGVSMPYFLLDFAFPDYSERPDEVSGYNFNLDWGEWGYNLPWFNELLGLLFDAANLPRWEMPDFSFGSWNMFNYYISELYEESEPKVSIDAWTSTYGDSKISCTRNCSVVKTASGSIALGGATGNYSVLDSNGNTIQVESGSQTLKKYDNEGNELLSVATDWTSAIAIGPDGYIYGYETTSTPEWGIIKRDPDDLSVISEFDLPDHDFSWYTIAIDSDGYVYILNSENDTIEKWDYDAQNLEASHSFNSQTNWLSIAVAGGLLACSDYTTNDTKTFWTMPTTLDEDQTFWTLTGDIRANGVAALENNYFMISAYDYDDEYYKLQKYDINQLLIQNQSIGHTDITSLYSIGSYPY